MAAPLPSAGDLLDGKYRVERVLGAGGMGVVVAAQHLQLRQTVALKFMRDESGGERAVERFLREARSAVRLRSPHVGKILDVGTLEGGAPYIVMEYLEGADFSRVLREQGRISAAAAAGIVLQACDAIAEAHALGIVHRDLKPANLFLAKSANGGTTVKVLDFGIAKASGGLEVSMTGSDVVFGSPAYMGPEQLRSAKNADERSDIWALGVILHEAVSGALPFRADNYADLCLRVMLDPTPAIPDDAGAPRGFAAVVQRCLEKDPAKRYPSIAELGAALARFASPEVRALATRMASRPESGASFAATGSDDHGLARFAGTAPRPRRWALLGVPVVLAAGAAVFFLAGGGRGATAATADAGVRVAEAPPPERGDAAPVAPVAQLPDAAAPAPPPTTAPAPRPVKPPASPKRPPQAPASAPAKPPTPGQEPKPADPLDEVKVFDGQR